MNYTLSRQKITLVVDLDGTFLESESPVHDPLYRLINEERPRFNLIFATGRSVESVLSVWIDTIIPRPDYIIGDVGATIVRGDTLEPLSEIQSAIDLRWPGASRVLEVMSGVNGIELQAVPQQRRCSFTILGDQLDWDDIQSRADHLQCDVLISANRYLDVLPRGVSKGSSLLALMQQSQIARETILCAGDTLNDLSLFKTGFNSVAVGRAEAGLLEAVSTYENVYVSSKAGTAGILDALTRLRWVAPPKNVARAQSQVANAGSESNSLVMVYHRQPFDEVRKGRSTIRRIPESPNGIIPTLLGFFSQGRRGAWIAWALQNRSQHTDAEELHFERTVPVDTKLYPNLVATRVPLSAPDVDLFYKRFSKEALWPVIFSFPSKVQIDHSHWDHFREINRKFAECAAADAEPGALVWIHDYNLWLVPGFLKQLRPDLRIAFFHHTSFPTPDMFHILPWRREIVSSLLQSDYLGFHIPRYVENFYDVVRSVFEIRLLERTPSSPTFLSFGGALSVDSYVSKIEVGGKVIRLGAHPVGIDVGRVREAFEEPSVQEHYHSLLSELRGRKAILSVERLDYVKGPIEKIEAFEALLEEHPELHEKIVFINIVTPPAPGMEVYRATRERLDQVIGRINGKFSRVTWTPIRYFYKSFPFNELVAFYAAADVAWITPLRDGLNLVCKEFVASKMVSETEGVLVLSEFAGASVEMHGAILTNPYDKRDLVNKLHHALTVDRSECAARLKQLISIVVDNDVRQWGDRFLAAFEASR